MAIRKRDKDKDKLSKDKRKKGEIAERRPFDLWTDMDRLFDQFRTSFDNLFWNRPAEVPGRAWNRTPPVDVADHGDRYEMNVELPGIPKDDIDVEVGPNEVEISAEHETEEESENKNWLRRERAARAFYRRLDLPDEVKTEDAKAEMKEGILKLQLPKVEPKSKKESKKVEIE